MIYNFVLFTDVSDTVVIYKAIGAYKCASVLRENGYSCLVVDHLHSFTKDEFESLISNVVGESTLAVGFSSTFMKDTNVTGDATGIHYKTLLDSALFPQGKQFEDSAISYIKSKNKNCKVLLGGAKTHPNCNNKLIDYAVIGFAEASILSLANTLSTGALLPNSHKNIWGVTIVHDKDEHVKNFQTSTFAWEKTDVLNASVLPIEIARGCIFKCKFCSYQMNGKQNLDFIRNTELIQQELQNNYDKYGIKNYYIIDDTFNDSEVKLDAMLAAVKKLSFQPYFWAYTRLDLIARKISTFQKLYDIGLRGFYFGIETMHNKTGRIIGKGYSRDKQIRTIQYIRNNFPDVLLHGSFIIGLPEEPLTSCQQTFDEIMSSRIPLHSFNFKGLVLYKNARVAWNSELSSNFQEYGYKEIPEVAAHSGRPDFNWSSEYTNRDDAEKLAVSFNETGQKSDMFRLPGQFLWATLNYYHDFGSISKMQYNEIDWAQFTQQKQEYIAEYKKQLFELTK